MDEHQQEESLSNYSDVSWKKVINVAGVDVISKAQELLATPLDFTQSPEAFLETVQSVLRLPAELVEQAIVFEQKHAKVCQTTKKALPSMPVEDAWCNQRKKELKLLSTRCVKHIGQDMCKHWSLPSNVVNVSRSRACDELLEQIDQRWEEGQRQYWDNSQQRKPTNPKVQKKVRRRGNSAEQILRESFSTPEGRQEILRCSTVKEVAALFDKAPSTIVETDFWKKKIAPAREAYKSLVKYHRLEQEERRKDRDQTE